MSRKTRLVAITVPLIGIVLLLALGSCGVDYVAIAGDIARYGETLDPEFCESIVHRIGQYNQECPLRFEILDCG